MQSPCDLAFQLRYAGPMLVRVLPLITGLVPLLGVTAAYFVGVRADVLPDCVPYLDGCTSISSTGRYPPGNLLFRAALFPQAVFLMFQWWFAAGWLRAVGNGRYAGVIVVSGVIGAIALILYVTFLGTSGELYEFMRRFGIYLYFLGTALCQLLFTLALKPSWIRRTMLAIVLTPWVLGILNLVQKAVMEEPNNIENRVEWIAAVLMQIWFLCLYAVWRQRGVTVTIAASK